MFRLGLRYFADMMSFAGAKKCYRDSANKRDAFPKAKTHNAEGE